MSNLAIRIITGLVAGGATVAMIALSAWGMYAFCLLVSVLGLYEFYRISGLRSRLAKWFLLGCAFAVWVYLLFFAMLPVEMSVHRIGSVIEFNWMPLFMVLLGVAAVLLLFEKKIGEPVREMGVLALGLFYVVLPFLLFFILSLDQLNLGANAMRITGELAWLERSLGYDSRIPLGILFLNWTTDTMAYFGGRYLGKHKLWERISPKKTWEGSTIGALACVGLGIGLEYWWPMQWSWIVVAVIVTVFSQLGDLVESMYKRGLRIKDSGGILPGHGGLLDRFDGMLIALPVVYAYVAAAFLIFG